MAAAPDVLVGAYAQVDGIDVIDDGTGGVTMAVAASSLEGNTWDGAVLVHHLPAADPAAGGKGSSLAAAAGGSEAPSSSGAKASGVGAGAGAAGGASPDGGKLSGAVESKAGQSIKHGATGVKWLTRTSLAYSTDVGNVEVVKVDSAAGTLKHTASLAIHHDVASGLAVLCDVTQSRIVSSSWDCLLHMWDLAAPRHPAQTFTGHAGPVHCVDWRSSNPDRVVSGSMDCTARVWALSLGGEAGVVSTPFPVTSVAWDPADDQCFAAGLEDGSVCVYDIRRLSGPVSVRTKHHGPVFCVEFSPSGHRLASGSDDTTVRITALDADDVTLSGHTDYVRDVAWVPGGLLTGSWDKSIRLWDLSSTISSSSSKE